MRRALILAAVLLLGGWLLAQSRGDATFVSSVDVRVVNVDVTVTDRDGNLVSDLLPSDFELLEDGAGQQITNFYRIVGGEAQLDQEQRAAGSSPQDERFRRRVVLVVDNNFLRPTERTRALGHVRDFVAERFGGDAEWAVAAIGEELQYLLPFTRERFQVASALDRIEGLPTYADRHALDRSLQNDPVRNQYIQTPAETGIESAYDVGASARFSSREQAIRNLRSFSVMAKVLGGLMRSYSGYGGRKAIVLITGAMEFHPEFQYLVSRDPRTKTDMGLTDRTQSDPGIEMTRRELEAVLAGLVRVANGSGFQIYTLSSVGLRNPMRTMDVTNRQLGLIKDTGSFAAPPDTSDLDSAPRTLSENTGGLALRSNRLEDDLARVVTDTSTYYSLGYQPSHAPDRRYHTIKVRVKRPGLTVRHREGYLDLTESEKLAESLATPLSFPKPKGPLPVELKVEELGADAGKVRVAAHVAVPMSSLTLLPAPQGGGLQGQVEVLLAIYNERGENLSVVPNVYPLQVPAGQEEAARAGQFKPTLTFTLEPGAYTVSATVRDPVIREHGTAVQNVLLGGVVRR